MPSKEMVLEARKAWSEYGEAIVRAFNFPADSRIVADGVETMLAHASDDQVKCFVEYVRQQTEEAGKWSRRS
jgi:hypothetical protein